MDIIDKLWGPCPPDKRDLTIGRVESRDGMELTVVIRVDEGMSPAFEHSGGYNSPDTEVALDIASDLARTNMRHTIEWVGVAGGFGNYNLEMFLVNESEPGDDGEGEGE